MAKEEQLATRKRGRPRKMPAPDDVLSDVGDDPNVSSTSKSYTSPKQKMREEEKRTAHSPVKRESEGRKSSRFYMYITDDEDEYQNSDEVAPRKRGRPRAASSHYKNNDNDSSEEEPSESYNGFARRTRGSHRTNRSAEVSSHDATSGRRGRRRNDEELPRRVPRHASSQKNPLDYETSSDEANSSRSKMSTRRSLKHDKASNASTQENGRNHIPARSLREKIPTTSKSGYSSGSQRIPRSQIGQPDNARSSSDDERIEEARKRQARKRPLQQEKEVKAKDSAKRLDAKQTSKATVDATKIEANRVATGQEHATASSKPQQCQDEEDSDVEMRGLLKQTDNKKKLGCATHEELIAIKATFKKVHKRYHEYVIEVGAKSWKRSLKKKRPRHLAGTRYSERDSEDFMAALEKPVSRSQTRHMYFDLDSDAEDVDSPIVVLPTDRPLPRMNHWSHIERNIVAKDKLTLSHMPYLDDEYVDEETFTKLLSGLFPGGIHGTKSNWKDVKITSRVLYEILKELKVEGMSEEKRSHFYDAAHRLFPNKTSSMDMREMVKELYDRYDCSPRLPAPAPFSHKNESKHASSTTTRAFATQDALFKGDISPIPEKDASSAQTSKASSEECVTAQIEKKRETFVRMLLESIRPVHADICWQCGHAFCSLHPQQQDSWSQPDATLLRPRIGAVRTEAKPCSDMCYIRRRSLTPDEEGDEEMSQDGEESRRSEEKYDDDDKGEVSLDDLVLPSPFWTKAEDDFLRAFVKSGRTVCEAVSQLHNLWRTAGDPQFISQRPCRLIYLYARVSGILEDGKGEKRESKKSRVDAHRAFRMQQWSNASKNGGDDLMKNKYQIIPCTHRGPCGVDGAEYCRCAALKIPCTKRCACPVDCAHRFPGCRCAPGNCHTKQCQCYFASWECDPDLCKNCKCGQSSAQPDYVLKKSSAKKLDLEAEKEYDAEKINKRAICRNSQILRGKQKKIYAGPSCVAGWGCFLAENAKQDELISEYCGEVITTEETERRGQVYDKLRMSYIFTLNEEQSVDATRAGNLIRFANHSKYPNCYARVYVVDGDHRIGIYARRDIKKHEELFFDYGYSRTEAAAFTSRERNLNLIRDKKSCQQADVFIEEDGKRRKKVSLKRPALKGVKVESD